MTLFKTKSRVKAQEDYDPEEIVQQEGQNSTPGLNELELSLNNEPDNEPPEQPTQPNPLVYSDGIILQTPLINLQIFSKTINARELYGMFMEITKQPCVQLSLQLERKKKIQTTQSKTDRSYLG